MDKSSAAVAVTGSVGYAILDPMSILFCALAVVVILIVYFVGKISTHRHLVRNESKDQLVANERAIQQIAAQEKVAKAKAVALAAKAKA